MTDCQERNVTWRYGRKSAAKSALGPQDAARVFSRWSQENFFGYMMKEYAIDLLSESPWFSTMSVLWRWLSGILALGVDFAPGHAVKANTVINRITENTYW